MADLVVLEVLNPQYRTELIVDEKKANELVEQWKSGVGNEYLSISGRSNEIDGRSVYSTFKREDILIIQISEINAL